MSNSEWAIKLALEAFAGKVDRSGEPMILHSLRVGLKGKTEDERIVGFLHDMIEDTDYGMGDLVAVGFSNGVCMAVEALTRDFHGLGETYSEFIERIANSTSLAIRVKLNDLSDNLGRAHELPTIECRNLTKRWTEARCALLARLGQG